MKRIVFYLFIAASFVQCTQDESTITTDEESQDLILQEISLDLSNAAPNVALDTTNKGLFVGTLATTDLSFHEKIFINIENDGNTNAQIITPDTKHAFQGQQLTRKGNTYLFTGEIGQFTVTLEDNEAIITEASFYDMTAEVKVFKSTSQLKMTPTLGTFTATQNGTATGTWDIMFTATNEDRYDGAFVSVFRLDANDNTLSSHVLQNSFLLRYTRRCDEVDAMTGTRLVQLQLFCTSDNNSGNSNVTINGQVINYTYRLRERINIATCDYPTPDDLGVITNEWSWGGASGTIDIDINTLPVFL